MFSVSWLIRRIGTVFLPRGVKKGKNVAEEREDGECNFCPYRFYKQNLVGGGESPPTFYTIVNALQSGHLANGPKER